MCHLLWIQIALTNLSALRSSLLKQEKEHIVYILKLVNQKQQIEMKKAMKRCWGLPSEGAESDHWLPLSLRADRRSALLNLQAVKADTVGVLPSCLPSGYTACRASAACRAVWAA